MYEEAKAGARRLTPSERRRVLIYLEEIGDTKRNNYDLAKLFQCHEKGIRQDKQRLLNEYARKLNPQYAMQFVGRHMKDLEDLVVVGKLGLQSQERGVLGERFYIETLLKLYKERREALENMGVIRKELGQMSVTEEHWIATVAEDGEASVHEAPTPQENL